ncbi:hypothetical protein MHYP_G00027020 [Metynnis hypsauchen]
MDSTASFHMDTLCAAPLTAASAELSNYLRQPRHLTLPDRINLGGAKEWEHGVESQRNDAVAAQDSVNAGSPHYCGTRDFQRPAVNPLFAHPAKSLFASVVGQEHHGKESYREGAHDNRSSCSQLTIIIRAEEGPRGCWR